MNYPFFISIRIPGEDELRFIAMDRQEEDAVILTTTTDLTKALRFRDYSRARTLFANLFDRAPLVHMALLKLEKKPTLLSYQLHRDDPRSSKMIARTYYFDQ